MSKTASTIRKTLNEYADRIDISPATYVETMNRADAVKATLKDAVYQDNSGVTTAPELVLQGSFSLGTMVRPFRDNAEVDYDLDVVLKYQLPDSPAITPESIKKPVGEVLHQHGVYCKMLEPEGKRCWTLRYAEHGSQSFHIDILPALSSTSDPSSTLRITTKLESQYEWSVTDPEGYASWFHKINKQALQSLHDSARDSLLTQHPELFSADSPVPTELIRTPLQRTVQVLKRHRDVFFGRLGKAELAPKSIIITTLAAGLCQPADDTSDVLVQLIETLQIVADAIENNAIVKSSAVKEFISFSSTGQWYVPNPVIEDENFAETWQTEHAQAFAQWLRALRDDFLNVSDKSSAGILTLSIANVLGCTNEVPASTVEPSGNVTHQVDIQQAPKKWG